MANDFFDSFGETISRTARELSEKAENFYEVQKLRNQISAEERVVSKAMERLGGIIYKRYEGGESVDDEIAGICGERFSSRKSRAENLSVLSSHNRQRSIFLSFLRNCLRGQKRKAAAGRGNIPGGNRRYRNENFRQ